MNRRELFSSPFKYFREISNESENETKVHHKVNSLTRKEIIMSMGGDFSSGRMAQEVMRLGIDPSNLSEDDMVDIILARMQKPTSEAEESENTETNNITNT